MTDPQPPMLRLEPNTDVSLSAVPGAEDLPTLVVAIETDAGVYVIPEGAAFDPAGSADPPTGPVERTGEPGRFGTAIEFGLLIDGVEAPDPGSVPFAALPTTPLGGAHKPMAAAAAAPPGAFAPLGGAHKPMGSLSYGGAVRLGGHHKVT